MNDGALNYLCRTPLYTIEVKWRSGAEHALTEHHSGQHSGWRTLSAGLSLLPLLVSVRSGEEYQYTLLTLHNSVPRDPRVQTLVRACALQARDCLCFDSFNSSLPYRWMKHCTAAGNAIRDGPPSSTPDRHRIRLGWRTHSLLARMFAMALWSETASMDTNQATVPHWACVPVHPPHFNR